MVSYTFVCWPALNSSGQLAELFTLTTYPTNAQFPLHVINEDKQKRSQLNSPVSFYIIYFFFFIGVCVCVDDYNSFEDQVPIDLMKPDGKLSCGGLNVWRVESRNVACLALTRKTETHEAPVFCVAWCCQPTEWDTKNTLLSKWIWMDDSTPRHIP